MIGTSALYETPTYQGRIHFILNKDERVVTIHSDNCTNIPMAGQHTCDRCNDLGVMLVIDATKRVNQILPQFNQLMVLIQ